MYTYFLEFKNLIQKEITKFDNLLSKTHFNKINNEIMSNIYVNINNNKIKLQNIASINYMHNRITIITPYDFSYIKKIEKSLIESKFNFKPIIKNGFIKILLPLITYAKKIEMFKFIQKELENIKIIIRNLRRNVINKYKNLLTKKEISKDVFYKIQNNIQKIIEINIKYMNNKIIIKKKQVLI